jgi:hypothetical protein
MVASLVFGVRLIVGIAMLLPGCSRIPPRTVQQPATNTPPGPQELVEKAKEDLAKRLTITVAQIRLVETTEVEWSDSSLGCPQPGMSYAQVLTPGYRVLLEADGKRHEYHSNRANYVVYCAPAAK